MIAWFKALTLLGKVLAVVLPLLALWGAYGIWKWSLINEGKERARIEMREKDDKAVKRGAEGIRDVVTCHTEGGEWDATTGRCNL